MRAFLFTYNQLALLLECSRPLPGRCYLPYITIFYINQQSRQFPHRHAHRPRYCKHLAPYIFNLKVLMRARKFLEFLSINIVRLSDWNSFHFELFVLRQHLPMQPMLVVCVCPCTCIHVCGGMNVPWSHTEVSGQSRVSGLMLCLAGDRGSAIYLLYMRGECPSRLFSLCFPSPLLSPQSPVTWDAHSVWVAFMWFWGSKLRSSHFHDEHFYLLSYVPRQTGTSESTSQLGSNHRH